MEEKGKDAIGEASTPQPALASNQDHGEENMEEVPYAPYEEFFIAMVDLIKNPRLIKTFSAHLKERNRIERERLHHQVKLNQDRISGWNSMSKHFFWGRIVLSTAFIGCVSILAYNTKIEPAVTATILTAVAASLFIQPKKD